MSVSITSSSKRTGNTILAAYLILKHDNQICLLLRKNTGYCDGQYGLISGHVEDGESVLTAMIREAEEEAGLKLTPSQLKVVHILHRRSNRQGMDVFFECNSWTGTVKNQEPDKCGELAFFPLSQLPLNTIGYIIDVLQSVSRNEFYSEAGW